MNASAAPRCSGASHELHFQSLFDPGRGLSFPCDAQGRVDLDRLSTTARRNYFRARTAVGREYAEPAVLPAESTARRKR